MDGSCPSEFFSLCLSLVGGGSVVDADVLTSCVRSLEEKFGLNLPQYPGLSQIVELPQQQDGESSQKL